MAVGEIQNVVLIGAGNLATHMGIAMHDHLINVVQVCNRTAEKGKKLATRLESEYIATPQAITLKADLYILAVTDDMIREVALTLPLKDQMVIHTAGAMDMTILENVSENIGVFYPVQTFSGNAPVDFQNVPLCLESNTKSGETQLANFAGKLSSDVTFLDSNHRQILHLSAVFACNFTNFMQVIAENLLKDHDISFDLIKPLISSTLQNFRRDDLFIYQTGPAVRGDIKVLCKHRELLLSNPEYLELYNQISNSIINYKKIHGKL